ncbi:polycystic kidney disease protein 1-like 2 [Mya arenaria]|uniref:polycystic kidney disease protein 1-like 2 n=1 Tax=Mya arenaria TaxID=6604 RepID=UPI0022E8E4FD|nr:polycystic kidney disease protein 1-like 2 [Mya arenaria]
MFEQHVHVVEGDPPQVLIRCMVNCKVKMNPSSEFSLLAVCETCHYWDTIDFHWSLYLHDHHDNVLKHDLENITSTDLVSAGLALVGGVLKGGRRYHLRLDVKVHGYTATFTEYAFITNLPPYGGNCSIEPLSGYALSTVFEISCRGWLNPGEEQFRGEGLLYQFWTRVRGGSDTQLLYYGTDPFTAPSKFPLGRKEMEYAHDIVVRISNAIGEYVETTLESKVLPKPQHDLAEVRSLAEDRSGPLFTMKEAGQDQEYKQLIVAMASVLNNKDSGEDIPSVVTSTSETPNIDVDDNEDAVETQGLEDVEKQKNIVIRSTIVEHLSGTDHVTLDALQQTALCFKVITVQTDELTADTQSQAMTAITKMSGEFETIMSEPSKLQSTDQVILAAKEMLSSVGNVMLAARHSASSTLETMAVDTELISEVTAADGTEAGLEQLEQQEQATANSDVLSKAKKVITAVFAVKDRIVETLVKTQTPGQELDLYTDAFTILTRRQEINKIGEGNMETSSGKFVLPRADVLLPNDSLSDPYVDVNLVEFPMNPYLWSHSAQFIHSPVVSLNLVDSSGHDIPVVNLSHSIQLDITLDPAQISTHHVEAYLEDRSDMDVHSFWVNSNTSSIHIIVLPENTSVPLEVFVQHGENPTALKYLQHETLPKSVDNIEGVTDLPEAIKLELRYTLTVTADLIQLHGTGWWYVAIRNYDENAFEPNSYEDLSVYYDNDLEQGVTITYDLQLVTSGCYYWNVKADSWTSDGCVTSQLSNTNFTRCLCNHLTSFGSEFYVPPNHINFERVFSTMESDLRDNHAVLALLCTVTVLYVVGVVWAWRQDKKDIQKWGVLPLVDNIVSDSYFYEMTVYTGMRQGAGTASNISFVLAGDHIDTGVRQLRDEKRLKEFNRGSINNFVLSADEQLGSLVFLRVWHDNSGAGSRQGWYLSRVVVRELFGHENVYVFLCNRWLAVEEDDGMVDRLLPVAAHEDIASFGNIFYSDTRKRLTDSHLWISVFARPNRSNFTRVQRVSCLFSLLMMSMLASAMFYRAEDNLRNAQGYTLGPFKFTLQEIYTSVVTSILVFPVTILIDQFFRRSKPKERQKEQAFRPHRPASSFTQNFYNIFRPQTRTQVSPISENVSSPKHRSYRPSKKVSVTFQDVASEESPPCTPSNLDLLTPTETPAPAVFVSSKNNASPPSVPVARHHHTPAPPLHLNTANETSQAWRFKQNVELHSNEEQEKLPFKLPQRHLTPRRSMSFTNSPAISPRAEPRSPTESIFSFDSVSPEIEDITMKNNPARGTTARQGKLLLPHWCVYIAWTMVFLTSSISAGITFLYSIEWGKEKSLAWLTSMLLTIVESVSIIQPAKILLVGIFVAAILRKTEEVSATEEISDLPDLHPRDISRTATPTRTKRLSLKVEPPNEKKLAAVRSKRLNELKMFRVVQEIGFYMMYLVILILVASHNRDHNSYRSKETLLSMISPKKNLSRVHDIGDLWDWVDTLLVPALYPAQDWNGATLVPGSRLIATQAAYRIGPLRLRQHRVEKDTCNRAHQMIPYIEACSFDLSEGHDSTRSYSEGWGPVTNQSVADHMTASHWVYKSTMELNGVPYAGQLGIYNGGGYVADLIGPRSHVTNMVATLKMNNWIDRYTRLVMLEFTTYNPNTNLFTVGQVSFELPTTGLILSQAQIYTFRLFSYLGGYGIFVIISELCAFACVVYFIALELKQIRTDGRKHFRSFWNMMQFLTLLISVICVVMYLLRHAMTAIAVESVTKLKDKFYNFQRISSWDELFQTLLAVAIFSSILKLIHILRFNRRMSMLAGTLKLAAKELSAFTLILAILLFAFVACGHFLFGSTTGGFKNIIQGFETLLSFSLGSFNFQNIIDTHRVFGPIYFFLFFMFVMFVLLNMFVTILNEAFSMVHRDVTQQKNEYEILEFLWGHLKTWVGFDLDKVLAEVKHKFKKDSNKMARNADKYTMSDVDNRLDLLLASLDHMWIGPNSTGEQPVGTSQTGAGEGYTGTELGNRVQYWDLTGDTDEDGWNCETPYGFYSEYEGGEIVYGFGDETDGYRSSSPSYV